MADNETYKQLWDNLVGGITHVSSDNGSVYLNNLLLDECYDIQYAYREMKEPIYGYRSKHFDAVLPGTVLITGQFTINYIHDGYLFSMINSDSLLGNDDNTLLTNGLDDIVSSATSAGINTSSFENGRDYRNTLDQYNDLRKLADNRRDELSKISAKKNILEEQIREIGRKKLELKAFEQAEIATIEKDKTNLKDSWWSPDQGYDNVNEETGETTHVQSKDERLVAAEAKISEYKIKIEAYQSNKDIISTIQEDVKIGELKWLDEFCDLSEPAAMLAQLSIGSEEGIFIDLYDIIQKARYILNAANEEFKNSIEELVSPGFFFNDENDLFKMETGIDNIKLSTDIAIKALDARLIALDMQLRSLNDNKDQINALDSKLDALRIDLGDASKVGFKIKRLNGYSEVNSLQAFRAGKLNGKGIGRAEDSGALSLVIMYNDKPHKRINGVHLLGHSHFLAAGDGSPIKEVYSFLANNISSIPLT